MIYIFALEIQDKQKQLNSVYTSVQIMY